MNTAGRERFTARKLWHHCTCADGLQLLTRSSPPIVLEVDLRSLTDKLRAERGLALLDAAAMLLILVQANVEQELGLEQSMASSWMQPFQVVTTCGTEAYSTFSSTLED